MVRDAKLEIIMLYLFPMTTDDEYEKTNYHYPYDFLRFVFSLQEQERF